VLNIKVVVFWGVTPCNLVRGVSFIGVSNGTTWSCTWTAPLPPTVRSCVASWLLNKPQLVEVYSCRGYAKRLEVVWGLTGFITATVLGCDIHLRMMLVVIKHLSDSIPSTILSLFSDELRLSHTHTHTHARTHTHTHTQTRARPDGVGMFWLHFARHNR
jgi:hypothetical protein